MEAVEAVSLVLGDRGVRRDDVRRLEVAGRPVRLPVASDLLAPGDAANRCRLAVLGLEDVAHLPLLENDRICRVHLQHVRPPEGTEGERVQGAGGDRALRTASLFAGDVDAGGEVSGR